MQWYAARKAEQAREAEARQTYPSPTVDNTTPRQRSFIFGHALSQQTTDHRRETTSFRNWNYISAHAKAMQLAQATVDVGRAMSQVITKGNEAHDTTTANEEKLPNHPLMRRFAKPNPIDNQMTYLYRIGLSISLTGAAFIVEIKNKLGLPLEWWCLPRFWFQPMLAYSGMPNGGWRVTPTNYGGFGLQVMSRFKGSTFYLHRDEVMQIGWPDPYTPAEFTSPMSACSDIIDVADQRVRTLNVLLQNAMNPSMILSIMGQMPKTEKERMIAELKARKQGPHNAHEVLLLENIEKYEMGGKVNEIESATGIDQDRENVMGILGVPPAASGMGGEDGYSAISAKLNSFSESQVQPLCSLVAKTKEERYRWMYKDPLLTVNVAAKRFDDPTMDQSWADKYLTGYEKGVFTLNQVLAVFGEPAAPDGDERFDPNAQQDMMGAPGDPNVAAGGDQFDLSVPGMEQQPPSNDKVGRPDLGNQSPEFDLSVDLPNSRLTGIKQPDMQNATGLKMPRPYMNGKH